MAITKKQHEELTTRYKNYYRTLSKDLAPDDLRAELQTSFNELENIMKILNFKDNEFIELKNSVMNQYDFQLYIKYLDLNNLIDEISGSKQTFEYEYKPKYIYKRIDLYDFDRRYGALNNMMHDIRNYIKNGEDIRVRLEKQIESMIA